MSDWVAAQAGQRPNDAAKTETHSINLAIFAPAATVSGFGI
jgi:hypothetical protein